MKGKSALLAGVAAVALVMSAQAGYAAKKNSDATSAAPAPAVVDTSKYDELAARVDALEAELQAAEMRSADDHNKVAAWKTPTGWWDSTSISGRMYYDVTSVSNKHNGVASSSDGVSFDIKRFYVGIDHKFNDVYSANVTTDVGYDSTASLSQVYIKKAYLQAKYDPMFTVRIGAADMAWVPYAEGIYGYRHIENTVIDRTKFGTSADWGVHILGTTEDKLISYQLSVVSGVGYKKAFDTSKFRSKHPDVEGRISLNYEGFDLAVGGYWGDLGAMRSAHVYHDATREDALIAYNFKAIPELEGLKLGVEFFAAQNYTQVTSATKSNAWGVSPFVSYQVAPLWTVFGRYDHARPYSDASRKKFVNDYYNIGVQYSPTKIVDFALVYKHDVGKNGYLADSNGTIGGSAFAYGNSGNYNEIGIFGQLRW